MSDVPTLSETILNNIRTRRTVPYQRMKPDAIPQHEIEMILEAANWAPSHKHTEPWHFYVFTGDGRKQLSAVLGEAYRSFCGEAFTEKKFQKTTTRPLEVPLTIAMVMRMNQSPNPRYEEILAMGGAAQNLQLAARSLGIVNSWSTPGYCKTAPIKDFFQIGEKDLHCGFFYMGYCAEGDIPTSKRRPLGTKVTMVDA